MKVFVSELGRLREYEVVVELHDRFGVRGGDDGDGTGVVLKDDGSEFRRVSLDRSEAVRHALEYIEGRERYLMDSMEEMALLRRGLVEVVAKRCAA